MITFYLFVLLFPVRDITFLCRSHELSPPQQSLLKGPVLCKIPLDFSHVHNQTTSSSTFPIVSYPCRIPVQVSTFLEVTPTSCLIHTGTHGHTRTHTRVRVPTYTTPLPPSSSVQSVFGTSWVIG